MQLNSNYNTDNKCFFIVPYLIFIWILYSRNYDEHFTNRSSRSKESLSKLSRFPSYCKWLVIPLTGKYVWNINFQKLSVQILGSLGKYFLIKVRFTASLKFLSPIYCFTINAYYHIILFLFPIPSRKTYNH